MSTMTLELPGFAPVAAPRPTAPLPVAPIPVALGDHVKVPHTVHPSKGIVGGEAVALYGPDGKGKGPRVTIARHGSGKRETYLLSEIVRVGKPEEVIDNFFAEREVTIVIPCGGQKLDHAAPAGELYTGSQHRLARQAADTLARNLGGRVVILSAKHGLLDLDTVIEPYNVKAGTPDAVDERHVHRQLVAMDARRVIALTPKAYTDLLRNSTRIGTRLDDRLAGTTSIFEQRTVLARIKAGEWLA